MNLISRLIVIVVFFGLLFIIIAFARGYRLDFEKQSITPTGIISISAYPKASKIYVNGAFKGVTDMNLTLPPGKYQIDVSKDGFTSWHKNLELKGELVLTLDVLLYPLNPSLSPLTNLGVVKAVPFDQADKVILFSDNGDDTKDGIYLFDLSKNPLSFIPPLKLLALKKNLPVVLGTVDFNETSVDISSDNTQAIFTFKTPSGDVSYLLSLENENKDFFDISASKDVLIEAWNTQSDKVNQKILEAYPLEFAKIATDSFRIIGFSQDESKVLYQPLMPVILPEAITPPLIATNQTSEERSVSTNELYVYDKKEDKNYPINAFDKTNTILWFSDSKHLVVKEDNKISVIDYDGTNKQTIYSGPFVNNFIKVANDGRILIITNLNPEANKFPDLFSLGIK